MNRIMITPVCAAILLATSTGFSQTRGVSKAARMSSAEYQRTIAELSSPSYRIRVAATERLAKQGKQAKADLSRLAKHNDAEVRSRATQLLARFDPVKKPKPSNLHIAGDEIVLLEGGVRVVLGGGLVAGVGEFEIIGIDGTEIAVVEAIEEAVEEVETVKSVVLPPIRHVDRADDLPAVDIPRFLKELEGTDDD